MAPEEIFRQLSLWTLKGEFTSSNLHILLLIYPIPVFTCVDPDPDPYLEYGSGSTKVLNSNPIWIRINLTFC